jgi:protocatechuate 3,4-dioxygenase beta subunit
LAIGACSSEAQSQSTGQDLYQRAIKSFSSDTPADRAVTDLGKALDAGFERPSEILTAAAWERLRTDPQTRKALRELLAKHAMESELTMVSENETGRRLKLEIAFVERKSGAPLAGERVYLYHTDDAGDYAPEADSPGGGSDNPRLFAFARTDDKGRVVIHTILPGAYRGTNITRHVHLSVSRGDSEPFGTGIYFDTDPGLDQELRDEGAAGRVAIGSIEADGDAAVCKIVFRVPAE